MRRVTRKALFFGVFLVFFTNIYLFCQKGKRPFRKSRFILDILRRTWHQSSGSCNPVTKKRKYVAIFIFFANREERTDVDRKRTGAESDSLRRDRPRAVGTLCGVPRGGAAGGTRRRVPEVCGSPGGGRGPRGGTLPARWPPGGVRPPDRSRDVRVRTGLGGRESAVSGQPSPRNGVRENSGGPENSRRSRVSSPVPSRSRCICSARKSS